MPEFRRLWIIANLHTLHDKILADTVPETSHGHFLIALAQTLTTS